MNSVSAHHTEFDTIISKRRTGWVEVTGYRGRSAVVNIPKELNGMPVLAVARSAFHGRQDIREVRIADGVEMIDVEAFADCGALRTVRFPNTLTHLRTGCFLRCEALVSADLPAALEKIESDAFQGCTALRRVDLRGRVEKIGDRAFAGCTSLRELTFPDAPERIGADCFGGTPLPEEDAAGFVTAGPILLAYRGDAQRVRIPDGITVMAAGAFQRCFRVLYVTLPAGLRSVGDRAFEKCSALRRVTGTADVRYLGAHAFEDCADLEELPHCPALTEAGEYAFAGCRSVRRLALPGTLTEIPAGLCRDCTGAEQVYFPTGLTRIGPYAFENCPLLTHLPLPDCVEVISRSAFASCSGLLTLDLPAALQTLEEGAFSNCSSLLSASVKHWNYYMGRLGEGLHIDLKLLNEDGSLRAAVFYSDDWRRFSRGGRAALAMALYHAPEIDYAEYDACFDLLLFDEDRAHFALDRLLWPEQLKAETAGRYRDWIRAHGACACAVTIRRNMEQAALCLCREDLIAPTDLDAALELAGEAGASSILMIFLNHKKNAVRDDIFEDLFRID